MNLTNHERVDGHSANAGIVNGGIAKKYFKIDQHFALDFEYYDKCLSSPSLN